MKSIFLGILVLFLNLTSAQAQGLLYEGSFDVLAKNYIELLEKVPADNWAETAPGKREFCQQRYEGLLEDGVLDIRIAVGYFDWTTNLPTTAYGVSPSIDPSAFVSLRKFLLSPCRSNSRFCGFVQDPSNMQAFMRYVQIQGQTYLARIEIQYSSATEYLSMNLGQARGLQQMRTQYAERFFANALQKADAALYFGHSRDGGGPDFAPPVFIQGQNKVDYQGYYIPRKIGLQKMVEALSDADQPAPVIGLFSCDSRGHFLREIREAARESGLISSTAVINIEEAYTAMIGATDALLRGQCNSFYKSIRLTPNNAKSITMDGMFE